MTGGHCKLQWRADWAMRWAALEVDYEISGKDLIDSVRIGSRICRILDREPPAGFTYELFLDENGEKISKSRGNGLTIEEWLRYATPESLQLFLYQHPKKARRLFFDVIPRHVDDYQSLADAWVEQDGEQRLGNPLCYIHDGDPPLEPMPISFAMLLNLATVAHAEQPEVLWKFIRRYAPECTPERNPRLARLVEGALAYHRDFVAPKKKYRLPQPHERAALVELRDYLAGLAGGDGEGASAEAMQHEIYEIGKRHEFANLRDWFKAIYECLLGQSEGPRFGSFVAYYGIRETRRLIDEVLARTSDADDVADGVPA